MLFFVASACPRAQWCFSWRSQIYFASMWRAFHFSVDASFESLFAQLHHLLWFRDGVPKVNLAHGGVIGSIYLQYWLPTLIRPNRGRCRADSGINISSRYPMMSLILFSLCMLLHGELYRSRPAASSLTSFYLAVSGGGALGGIFVGAVAVRIFERLPRSHNGLPDGSRSSALHFHTRA